MNDPGVGAVRRVAALLGLLFAMSNASCKNADPSIYGDDMVVTGTVSLRRDVQPVFTSRCALAGCHSTADASAGLVLAAGRLYDRSTGIVGVASVEVPALLRVEPRNADGSYLVRKLDGTQAEGDRMPLGDTPLSDSQIGVIRRWIDEGALDN